jgi:hypothetical protein
MRTAADALSPLLARDCSARASMTEHDSTQQVVGHSNHEQHSSGEPSRGGHMRASSADRHGGFNLRADARGLDCPAWGTASTGPKPREPSH